MISIEPVVSLDAQLQSSVGCVVLLNHFEAPAEVDDATFISHWSEDAAYFKRQPGFISAQLHRGIGTSRLWVNYAVWESAAALAAAVKSPEFKSPLQAIGCRGVPKLYRTIAVPNICLADTL